MVSERNWERLRAESCAHLNRHKWIYAYVFELLSLAWFGFSRLLLWDYYGIDSWLWFLWIFDISNKFYYIVHAYMYKSTCYVQCKLLLKFVKVTMLYNRFYFSWRMLEQALDMKLPKLLGDYDTWKLGLIENFLEHRINIVTQIDIWFMGMRHRTKAPLDVVQPQFY